MKIKKIEERIPEGGAILDAEGLSAEAYGESMRRRLWSEYGRFAGLALKVGNPPRGARVLELGPGPGWISLIIGRDRKDLHIDAVDASPDMVRAAKKNLSELGSRVDVRVGFAETLTETVSGPYDLIYSRDSLHHWTEPKAAFLCLLRLLSPSGVLILQDGRRDLGLGAKILVGLLSRTMGAMGAFWRSSLAAGYTADELRTFTLEAGFSRVSVQAGLIDLSLVAAP